jgi:DNA-binding transcriptional regulator YiaG
MNGDEITRRRKALGLTQTELAEAVGVHPITVNRWEVGKATPSGLALRVLSQTLDELERKAARNARDRATRAAKRTSTG